jgi:hypothetical protein
MLLPTMSPLNNLPPPKIGVSVEVAMTGVLEVAILTGPPLLLPLPRTPKSLPSVLTAVPGIAKGIVKEIVRMTAQRKSQTIR